MMLEIFQAIKKRKVPNLFYKSSTTLKQNLVKIVQINFSYIETQISN